MIDFNRKTFLGQPSQTQIKIMFKKKIEKKNKDK